MIRAALFVAMLAVIAPGIIRLPANIAATLLQAENEVTK